jgi:hypothetical protein
MAYGSSIRAGERRDGWFLLAAPLIRILGRMAPGGIHEVITGALVSYARRELDAVTAATRVCDAVSQEGSPSGRCALVAMEATSDRVVAGNVDEADRAVLAASVTLASSRRLIVDRAAGDRSLFSKVGEEIDWIAVEPITTRGGTYIGALAAMGARDVRNDILAMLPGASLVCEAIAFELLCQPLLGRRLHRFNNLLATLTANVEQITSAVARTDGNLSEAERELIIISAGFATEGVASLLEAAVHLRDAVPTAANVRTAARVRRSDAY